jgi:hypothetical protein
LNDRRVGKVSDPMTQHAGHLDSGSLLLGKCLFTLALLIAASFIRASAFKLTDKLNSILPQELSPKIESVATLFPKSLLLSPKETIPV